jgi:hypothetical protein
MQKRMIRGDWKSAEQIGEDIEAGHAPDLLRLVLDLWQRVDELRGEKTALWRGLPCRRKIGARRWKKLLGDLTLFAVT